MNPLRDACAMVDRLVLDGGSHMLQQDGVVEWFRQKLNGSGSQCLHSRLCAAMCSDKNCRYPAIVCIQPCLQLQTGHPWHSNIGNQTSCLVLTAGSQKILS